MTDIRSPIGFAAFVIAVAWFLVTGCLFLYFGIANLMTLMVPIVGGTAAGLLAEAAMLAWARGDGSER